MLETFHVYDFAVLEPSRGECSFQELEGWSLEDVDGLALLQAFQADQQSPISCLSEIHP